jgi:Leucine-rich repeat (LRR) protein
VGEAGTPGVQEILQRIVEMEPNTEFLDLSNRKIRRIEEIEEYLRQLRDLQDLNLEDNLLESLPPDLSLIFPRI